MRSIQSRWWPALCALLTLTTTLQAGDKGRLSLKDVFELQYASDPQISPGGERVVYVRNFMDIMKDKQRSNLWIINVDGTGHRPITTGNRNDGSPRWSPKGDRLAYVSSESGSAQIHCRWMKTGDTAQLTRLTQSPSSLTWSPDGKHLAFSMLVPEKIKPLITLPDKPKGAEWAKPAKEIRRVRYRFDGSGYLPDGYHHLFVLSAEGGAPRQITSGSFHHQGHFTWTPDGQSLLFSANRNKDWEHQRRESEIYQVSIEDKSIKTITKNRGPDFHPSLSRDGKTIAWLSFKDEEKSYQTTRLYVRRWTDTRMRCISANLDRDIANPIVTGRHVYYQFEDQGITKIGRVDHDGQRPVTLVENVGGTTIGRPYASGTYSMSNLGVIAYTITSASHPADVAVLDPEPGKDTKPRRLTNLNSDLFADKELGKLETIRYKSSHDELEVEAWVLKPSGFDPKKKYPLILEIHGGPFANYGPRFSMEMQLYAAKGYVVLYVNPRGSTSYGEKFASLIHHNYPSQDYDDLMSGVDAVIRKGYVDEKQLFVTGGSGGGVLSAWVVGKTNRFRAAVVCKPVINWTSFVLTSDIYPFFAKYWFPAKPWENQEHYWKLSPLSLVGNVKTPTMLITGEVDHRTPMPESEQFYQALQLRKIESMLVRIPGASHNIAKRPSQLMTKVAYVLKWFEMHK